MDEDDFKDDFDYGDIADEDGFSSDLSFDDIFGNDEETSFEEELDNYDFNESDDLGSDDLNSTDSNISDSNSESDDFILDSNEESSLEETVSKPKEIKKVKKPKKAKKEKKIPEDAFDEKYKNSHEIEYDEDNNRWLAYMGGELIRSFDTPKEAVIERKKLLRRNVSIPRKGFNGKYSDEEGIDFDLRERIWTVSFNGIITNFATNEKDAIIKKKLFSLILDQLEINQDDFNEEIFDELKEMDLDSLLDSLNDDEFEEIGLSPKESKRKLN